MSLLNRLEGSKKVWELLLPWCQGPADSTFARWLAKFPDEELETVFYQAAARWEDSQPAAAEIVHKYVTGTLHTRKEKARKAAFEAYRREESKAVNTAEGK